MFILTSGTVIWSLPRPKMKDSARYVKIVEWNEEDGCYVGSARA